MSPRADGFGREIGRLSLRLVPAVVVFALLEPLIRGAARLPEAAYLRPVVLLALPDRIGALLAGRAPLSYVAAAALAALVIALRVSPRVRAAGAEWLRGWRAIDHGAALRLLFGFATGVAAWRFSAHAFNAYAGQPHLLDRLALMACWALILWRPILALPFALVLAALAGQMDVPLGAHSWTEVELLVRIPILLGAFWLARGFFRDADGDGLVFLFLALIAVTYWTSGLGKFEAGWLTESNLENLPAGAWAAGWLSFLEPETVGRVARVVGALSLPLVLGTLVVECGSLAVLAHRRALPAWLSLAIAFHLGVLAMTGIFFWKWMLVEAALLAFLLTGGRLARLEIFSRAHAVLFAVLLIGAPLWIDATDLTWRQTPLTYVTRFEGIDASGSGHTLSYDQFAPFGDSFVISTFPSLAPHARLTGAMGVTHDAEVAARLQSVSDSAGVFAIERAMGRSRYDAEFAAGFDEFVARYARYLNEVAGSPRRAPIPLRPPRHLWTFPRGAVWDGSDPLVRVDVHEDTYFFDGRRPHLIRTRRLRAVEVMSAGTRSPGSGAVERP